MNLSPIVGFFAGLIMIGAAVVFGSDNPSVFFHLPGLGIVVGGLFAAALISFPAKELARICKVLYLVIAKDKVDLTQSVYQIQEFSRVISREGLDALEENLDELPESFLKDGLEMVVDQVQPDELLTVLERRMELTYEREISEASLLRTLAKAAPAFGMLGTTLGLVTMMTHLDFDGFSQLGIGLATALTTTFYGLVLSHLLFTPLANRLEARAEERALERRLTTEGVLLLARRVPSALVLQRLLAYLPPRMWSRPPKETVSVREVVNQ